MKILLYLIVFVSTTSFAQCPDKLANYYTEQAEKFPKPKFQLLAEYYTKICPCTKGSDSPETLMNDINVIIDKINTTTNRNRPMPKVVRCVDNESVEPKSYIEWDGKKEFFTDVEYIGNIDNTFPKQMHLKNIAADGNLIKSGKKFQYIRISGFKILNDGEVLELNNENELKHIGIIDLENDNYYYTAKTAKLKGIGGNMYELLVDFYFTGSAGNNFQEHPKSPTYPTTYKLKAFFVFNPIFEMN